jgi:hypothetical protein
MTTVTIIRIHERCVIAFYYVSVNRMAMQHLAIFLSICPFIAGDSCLDVSFWQDSVTVLRQQSLREIRTFAYSDHSISERFAAVKVLILNGTFVQVFFHFPFRFTGTCTMFLRSTIWRNFLKWIIATSRSRRKTISQRPRRIDYRFFIGLNIWHVNVIMVNGAITHSVDCDTYKVRGKMQR